MTYAESKEVRLRAFLLFPVELRKKILYNTQVNQALKLFNDPTGGAPHHGIYASGGSWQGQPQPQGLLQGTITGTSLSPAIGKHFGIRTSIPTHVACLDMELYRPFIDISVDDCITLDDLIKADIDGDVHDVLASPPVVKDAGPGGPR